MRESEREGGGGRERERGREGERERGEGKRGGTEGRGRARGEVNIYNNRNKEIWDTFVNYEVQVHQISHTHTHNFDSVNRIMFFKKNPSKRIK